MRKKILVSFLLLAILIGGFIFFAKDYLSITNGPEFRPLQVPGKLVPAYLKAAHKLNIPWPYLAAIDEQNEYSQVGPASILVNAQRLRKWLQEQEPSPENIEQVLLRFYPLEVVDKITDIAAAYQWEAASLDKPYAFPVKDGDQVSYGDSWGAERSFGGKRRHEGTDIMAPHGTPLIAVSEGKIMHKGWDQLGGWRLYVQDAKFDHIFYYYAHLSKYVDGLEEGQHVSKGQLLGYVGSSGYGPEGTTGKFAPHLHFGVYIQTGLLEWKAINSYPFLKAWEWLGD